MKNVHGWNLPDSDTHFGTYLDNLALRGMTCEYQKQHRDTALTYCKSKRTAVDVGAHVGLWSRPLAAQFDTVYSFEPMAEFRELLALNSPTSKIIPFALGDLESRVMMELPIDNTGMAHIVPDSEESGDIEVRTLDSFALEHVDLIKIDCEGYEYPVILGATETLRRWAPVIIIEQKPHLYFSNHWEQYAAIKLLTNRHKYKVADRVIDDWILIPDT